MNNNYTIIRTIYENVFQRILECKDNATGEIFYSNIITSQKLINLINIEDLKQINSNILECYNTEDRIFIFTKPLDNDCRKFSDYVNNSLTLKQQFSLTEKSIVLAHSIYNMTDVVQQKILDLDRLYIDENDSIVVDCNLIFEQEYDIADNETFRRLGDVIHMIFSGTEIIDYNVSDTIPPDILKIVVRCLTKEYIFPKDALEELKRSSIYTMLFGGTVNEYREIDRERESPSINSTQKQPEDKVLNIYLENEEQEPTKKKKPPISKEIKRAVLSLSIVVAVLLVGNSIIKKVRGKEDEAEPVINPLETEIGQKPEQQAEEIEEIDENIEDPAIDSTLVHFNDQLIESIGYSGEKAEIDKNIFLEGTNSLMVANTGPGKVKALFAAVDFTDENYSYMLMQQIGVSAKIRAEKDLEALVVFEAYKNGAIKSNFHTLVDVYDDIWSQVSVPINVTDAELLNIYIEYEGENRVWIDSIFIDVMK